MKKGKRSLIFQQKSILATLLLLIIIVVGLVISYIECNRIAQRKGMDQFEDAANTVIDQISAKFDRDGDILVAAAEIISSYGVFDESGDYYDKDKLQDVFQKINPIRQTMNLRILLNDGKDTVILPDGTTFTNHEGEFKFEDELAHGRHISHRFISRLEDEEKSETPIIAMFAPIYYGDSNDNKVAALLYGVTALHSLPDMMRLSNIYNGNARVMIFDIKNETEVDGEVKHAVILDTAAAKGELGYFEDYTVKKTRRGKTADEVKSEILSIKNIKDGDEKVTGMMQFKSESTDKWMHFYYSSANDIVKDQWCIAIVVSDEIAFFNVLQIRNVFIILGSIVAVAIILYFIWIRIDAKKAIEKSVESAVLEEKLHKAEAAERAKTMFLSNMSHDIRTPMNAILGFTALAETNIDNKEKVQGYLKKILSSGNHLLSLINDILDMSRIESGKLNIDEKPCSISEIFRDMRNIIQTQMKNKQLNFFMDTMDVTDEDIMCDKLHLNQVILNLLSNSIKFTPAGGSVSLTITQKPVAPTGYGAYEIRVKDTGIGMSAEFAKHIFEPFERERTSTVSGIQGTGLGMAITKNIVDTMGGSIEVITEQGKGTEFIIELQFKLQNDRRSLSTTIREFEGLRALVVDDNFTTCDSISKMLMKIGMHAEWTLYGKEAVLRTRQAVDIGDPFAAYIIDWVMPDLSGFEIVRQIRKLVGDDVPIIIVTAYDVSAIMDEAKDIGVTAYCNKPVFMSELRDTLMSCIKKDVPTEEKVEETTDSQSLAGKRILLVEDNALNREIAEEVLIENGFKVHCAVDGSEAVEIMSEAEDSDYDIILMDVQMPVMNGYDATRAIRAMGGEKGKIPIVAMTANAFDEDRQKALESGMNAHIAKPIDIDKLLKVIRDCLLPPDDGDENPPENKNNRD